MYSIQNNNTSDHCHRSLSISSHLLITRIVIRRTSSKKGCRNTCALLGAIPCQLLGAVHLLLSLAHKSDHKKQRNKRGTTFPQRWDWEGTTTSITQVPNCCLQILQEIHKKCKACLESKEHLQLEEYFLACGINKCCTVLKVREG